MCDQVQECEFICADPVRAYDRIAEAFPRISQSRAAYLDAIDGLVVENIPSGSHNLLDVGAGDGRRACRIARETGISDFTLLEPSINMQKHWPANVQAWSVRAEDLGNLETTCRFDVITCLWNVLGHIPTAAKRQSALAGLARLLSRHGVIFLDVNHRYNARSYGSVLTTLRCFRDLFRPRETNGDVVVNWTLPGIRCSTTGHVFADREVRRLAHSARLRIEKRFVVDYSTGQGRCFAWGGNLLYVLRPIP
jgi:2-polyprenyl-3-methyl-5-hydroxy-6-metoxy-1,4-benzoquinol methylase